MINESSECAVSKSACHTQLSLNFHPTLWGLNGRRTLSRLDGLWIVQWRLTLGCFSAVFSVAAD